MSTKISVDSTRIIRENVLKIFLVRNGTYLIRRINLPQLDNN